WFLGVEISEGLVSGACSAWACGDAALLASPDCGAGCCGPRSIFSEAGAVGAGSGLSVPAAAGGAAEAELSVGVEAAAGAALAAGPGFGRAQGYPSRCQRQPMNPAVISRTSSTSMRPWPEGASSSRRY